MEGGSPGVCPQTLVVCSRWEMKTPILQRWELVTLGCPLDIFLEVPRNCTLVNTRAPQETRRRACLVETKFADWLLLGQSHPQTAFTCLFRIKYVANIVFNVEMID